MIENNTSILLNKTQLSNKGIVGGFKISHQKTNSFIPNKTQRLAPLINSKDNWDFDFSELNTFKEVNPSKENETQVFSFLREKAAYYSKNKNLNLDTLLSKKLNMNTKRLIELNLHSITIEFQNSNNSIDPIKVSIPFTLTPVFYYLLLNIEMLKKALCYFIKFNDLFNNLEYDFENLDTFLTSFSKEIFDKEITYDMFKNIPNEQTFLWFTNFDYYIVLIK